MSTYSHLPVSADTGGRRVLLVEDEGMIAMLLEDMLAEFGHRVVATAGNLELAEQRIRDTEFDFAVLDVNLNGNESYVLADMLQSRRVPFVFATGYAGSGLREVWRHVPLLQKPFQAKDLERAMKEVLAA